MKITLTGYESADSFNSNISHIGKSMYDRGYLRRLICTTHRKKIGIDENIIIKEPLPLFGIHLALAMSWLYISRRIPDRYYNEVIFDLFSRSWVPTAAFGTVAAVILLFGLIPGTDPLEEEFQSFMERREHLQNYHERLLFRGPFDRKRLGRNPFSIPVSLEYQNPFEE